MKRSRQTTKVAFWIAVVWLLLPPLWGQAAVPGEGSSADRAGYLESVTFERFPGRERVVLKVSQPPGVTVEGQPGSGVLIRLDNLYVPQGLQRPIAAAGLDNVLQVAPQQRTAAGRSAVLVQIDLRQKVPYSFMQSGTEVLIDFNVAALPATVAAPASPAPLRTAQRSSIGALKGGEEKKAPPPAARPAGPPIFLDVQDAEVQAVFRLLSEHAKVSIVAGDDVKGTVTLHLKNVPWELALETIVKIKGLQKIERDNVIMVMTQENFLVRKKVEDELARGKEKQVDTEPLITRVVPIKYRLLKFVAASKIEMKRDVVASGAAAVTPQRQAAVAGGAVSTADTATRKVTMEGAGDFFALLQSLLSVDSEGKQRGWIGADADTNSVIVTATRADMIKIIDMIARIDIPTEQIRIKAHIVETTKSMARDLGIKWGGSYTPRIGDYSGSVKPGFNFAAAPLLGTAATLDLAFGTIGGNILELQLSALQKDGKLNILSSPSIMTADNQMAFTENGEEIPIRTLDKDGNPTTKYEPATLRLEITPHVIDGENMKMDIHVKKDEVDMTRQVLGNPFKIKKETKTNLLVKDGETIVISGLTKQKLDDGTTGLPWLKDVPVLGWLAKGEQKSEIMEEVLIFLTPEIVKAQNVAGIQTGP